MSVPLPPNLPAPAPDEALVVALADETGVPAAAVRGWLSGERRLPEEWRLALLKGLWRPCGGIR